MGKAVAAEVDAQDLTESVLPQYGLQGVERGGGFAVDDRAVTRHIGEFPALAHDRVFVGTEEIEQAVGSRRRWHTAVRAFSIEVLRPKIDPITLSSL